MILSDYVKVSNIAITELLYDARDVERTVDKIEAINYHQEIAVEGVRFWCYNAGHVLGAAMFMIEIAGVHVLYTGDYSRQESRHLMAAEIPSPPPDVLIVESTYGIQNHEPRQVSHSRLLPLLLHFTFSCEGKDPRETVQGPSDPNCAQWRALFNSCVCDGQCTRAASYFGRALEK